MLTLLFSLVATESLLAHLVASGCSVRITSTTSPFSKRDGPTADRPELGEDRLRMVMIAARDPAACHDRVRREPLAQRCPQRVGRIGDDATDPRLGAGRADRRRERVAI